jgi:hypothetical protein
MSARRLLFSLAPFALVASLLAGCSDSTTTPPAAPEDDGAMFDATVDPSQSAFVLQRVEQSDPGVPRVRVDLIGTNLTVDPDEETVSIDVAIRNISDEPLAGPIIVWLGRFRPDSVVPLNSDFDDAMIVLPADFPFGYMYSEELGDDAVLDPEETSGTRTWIFSDPNLLPFTFAARVEVSPPPARPHIGGVVFLDLNRNGALDRGEPRIGAGEITMTRPDGGVAVTHPDPSGRYVFRVEEPGLYSLFYEGGLGAPFNCTTTPNPLRVILVTGPNGELKSVDDAHFGIDPVPCDGEIPRAVMTDVPLDSIGQDPYRLLEIRLREDTLVLRVGYSGCQPDHPFTLYVSSRFMESLPVQTVAVLAHDDLGEYCDAYFERTLMFDLAPLREAYIEAYGEPGEVIVRFRDFGGQEHEVLFGP